MLTVVQSKFFPFSTIFSVKDTLYEIEMKCEAKNDYSILRDEHRTLKALEDRYGNQLSGLPTILGMGYQSGSYYTITRRNQCTPLLEFVKNKFFPNSMVLRFAVEVVRASE